MAAPFFDRYPHLREWLGIEPPLAALGPGRAHANMHSRLAELNDAALFAGRRVTDTCLARCCHSGLWLAFDFLEESHRISQDIDTLEGSYWHGIMHRREPDYANAKYWFRRVPRHPVYETLLGAARELAERHEVTDPHAAFLLHQHTWNALDFVDLCEAIARGEARCESLAQEVALLEWQFLFAFCYDGAIG